MKPIKYELKENPNIIDFKEIERNSKMLEWYNFMPSWLEEVYNGANKEKLVSANDVILEYVNKRNEYEYYGTHKSPFNDVTEYYITPDNKIVCYLIDIKRKTPICNAIAIYNWENKMVN